MWLIDHYHLLYTACSMYILGEKHANGENSIKITVTALLWGFAWPLWIGLQIWEIFTIKVIVIKQYTWSGQFEYKDKKLYLRPRYNKKALKGLVFKDPIPVEDLHPDVRIKKANPHDINQIDEGALWFNEEPDGRLRLSCVSFNSTFTKKRDCNEEGDG